MNKRVFIKTYGCQMNVYDSDRMADVLASLGYQSTEAAEEADLIILNTCHIREKAEEKVYSDLGRYRAVKQGRGAMIAVGGCVGQAAGKEIMLRAPYVDMVFGPQSYQKLPEMLRDVAEKKRVVELEFTEVSKFDHLPAPSAPRAGSAFVSVQEGCDKFCTFCVVPYTRGAEFSRPAEDVLREVQGLAEQGVMEVTLLGQNVNAYHGSGWNLARLVRAVAEIPGIRRIRYTTSHPRDMDDDLVSAHAEVHQLMPFLHLPVQSGSDRILKAMNRKHRAADYLAIVEKLRAARPDLALSSDFIVGFPDETEEDFEETLRLVETVGFAQAYSFSYSPRPGTPAAEHDAQVEEAVKAERLQRLQALIRRQQLAFNQRMAGQSLEVLFEKPGKRPNQWIGKTPYLQSVYLESPESLVGRLAQVEIIEGYENSLSGRFTQAKAA